jgi:DNA processing protein
MQREELSGWLRLQLTPGVGDTSARKLLAAFGLPEQVFFQTESALRQVVTTTQAQALLTEPDGLSDLLDTTWQWLHAAPDQRRVLTLGDLAYPQSLLNLEDPPVLLYALGAPGIWDMGGSAGGLNAVAGRCLAVVGSRNPTPQGSENARQFSLAFAQAGLTVVSGLALGVDGAAHEGALTGAAEGQLATIAVVGTGLDRVYPKQHRDLAHRLAQRGVLLSEYPIGTPPLAANFPKRNRIIAGLAQGTLVVEAAMQSGSLITARLASEQGSDVFAIPGSIHSTQARGCHALIKQGAKLVESAQDVLEELKIVSRPDDAAEFIANSAYETGAEALLDPESSLLDALGFDPLGLDALQARTGLDTPTLQAQLMALELQGQVVRMPGGLFQRMARA